MRIGHGYDVHRFALGRKCILGGVDIPFSLGLAGHSDADVVTHAIMDALLGAAALGDIGLLFPDTDSAYKDVDSQVLLKRVCSLLKEKGYQIINIDCTVAAQQPKLRPFIEKMRLILSQSCNIDINCINIKATTEENLGFTGRMEGIKATAVCLIDAIPD